MPGMNPIVLMRNRASPRTRLSLLCVCVHHMQFSLSCNPLVRAGPLAIANVNLAEAQPKSMLHGTDQVHMTIPVHHCAILCVLSATCRRGVPGRFIGWEAVRNAKEMPACSQHGNRQS